MGLGSMLDYVDFGGVGPIVPWFATVVVVVVMWWLLKNTKLDLKYQEK